MPTCKATGTACSKQTHKLAHTAIAINVAHVGSPWIHHGPRALNTELSVQCGAIPTEGKCHPVMQDTRPWDTLTSNGIHPGSQTSQ
mmetsp:Transcript_19191/g.47749  ORF Transcript_19191/g.47749 Transcript_19191/m.47749 type:complete len:86 (-) Transcript_19191:1525-1782(-)|eukprot:6903579-Prymnesium_polylepis.1